MAILLFEKIYTDRYIAKEWAQSIPNIEEREYVAKGLSESEMIAKRCNEGCNWCEV